MSCPITQFDAQFCAYRALLESRARRSVCWADAEDLVCLCYLEARKSLTRYYSHHDATGSPFTRSLLAWLIGILDNLLRLHFRQARTHREDLYADAEPLMDNPDAQTARCAHQEAQWRRLLRRMEAVDLTARQYECVLRLLHGETQQQIADGLNISQRTVSCHVQAAQQHFANYNAAKNKAKAQDNKSDYEDEDDFRDAFDFFYQCAHQPIYHKPHSFDNQSTSEERERRRYACLGEERKPARLSSRKSKPH